MHNQYRNLAPQGQVAVAQQHYPNPTSNGQAPVIGNPVPLSLANAIQQPAVHASTPVQPFVHVSRTGANILSNLPAEIQAMILRQALVFPGQVLYSDEYEHPGGEPILQVRTPGQGSSGAINLPPLRDFLNITYVSPQLRLMALEAFFMLNTFDLTSISARPWLESLSPASQAYLTNVLVKLNVARAPNHGLLGWREDIIMSIIARSCTLRSLTIYTNERFWETNLSVSQLQA
jgi:hypothetical protein